MKKNGLLILMLMCSIFTSKAQITNPAPYCLYQPADTYNMWEYIKVGGQTQTFGPMGAWGTSFNTYLYYNNVTFPSVAAGAQLNLEVKPYAVDDAEPMYFAVFIDFNNNNIFETSEIVMQNSNTTMAELPSFGAPVTPIIKNILIPASTTAGTHRMRLVRDGFGGFAYDNAYVIIDNCVPTSVTGFGSCYDVDLIVTSASASVPVSSITVNSAGNATTVNTGGNLQMSAAVLPTNATNNTVTWSVQNGTGSATISALGMLTGVTAGQVTVKATANDGSNVTGTKNITVLNGINIPITSIAVNSQGGVTSINAGNQVQMLATVLPTNATNNSVTWSVQNGTGTATISASGMLTGVTAGQVTVKATANDGSGTNGTKSMTINVANTLVTSITVTSAGGQTLLNLGNTLQMYATVNPTNATNSNFTWSVANGTGSAIISNTGLLQAVSPGQVTVKATASDASGIVGTKIITLQDPTSTNNINAQNNSFNIYPNPIKNIFTISSTNKDYTFSITDLTGRKVSFQVTQNQVDISNLNKGVYLIHFYNSNGIITSKKIIKE